MNEFCIREISKTVF